LKFLKSENILIKKETIEKRKGKGKKRKEKKK
jgi:hypothetical protein